MDARDAFLDMKEALDDAQTVVLYADGQGRYDRDRAFAVAVALNPDGTPDLSWPAKAWPVEDDWLSTAALFRLCRFANARKMRALKED